MATFPQLLRKSKFATFDPYITRVYDSTPHSINRYGDWGLKSPIHRQKGPRYIKVSNLAAGALLGSDWRSAETEARFAQIHGTGRTPWRHHDDTGYDTRRSMQQYRMGGYNSLLSGPSESGKIDEPIEEAELMDNVDAMRRSQFERYLRDVRTYRGDFLAGKINSMAPERREKIRLPEDRTFVNLAARRHISDVDVGKFQVALAEKDINSKDSKIIQSVPHRLFGLSYSKIPQIAPESNPALYHKGRALDPAADNRGMRTRMSAARMEDTNRSWVVTVGGITGQSTNPSARLSDGDGTVFQQSTDYTREEPNKGEGNYKITRAVIRGAPTVVGLNQGNTGASHMNNRRGGHPLDTFRFDITVEPVGEGKIRSARDYGSPAYVRAEIRQNTEDLGYGGPRRSRSQGSAVRSLKADEVRKSKAENQQQIQDILAKLAMRKAQK